MKSLRFCIKTVSVHVLILGAAHAIIAGIIDLHYLPCIIVTLPGNQYCHQLSWKVENPVMITYKTRLFCAHRALLTNIQIFQIIPLFCNIIELNYFKPFLLPDATDHHFQWHECLLSFSLLSLSLSYIECILYMYFIFILPSTWYYKAFSPFKSWDRHIYPSHYFVLAVSQT